MNELGTFVTNETGKANVGTTSANMGQCVGLLQKWFAVVGAPFFYGNAKDFLVNAPASDYLKGTTWPAPAGAATVYNGTWGDGAGHTQLSLGNGMVFEQNNPTGSTPHTHDYGLTAPKGYIGYILPKNFNEGDNEVTQEQYQALMEELAESKAREVDLKSWLLNIYKALAGQVPVDQLPSNVTAMLTDIKNWELNIDKDVKGGKNA